MQHIVLSCSSRALGRFQPFLRSSYKQPTKQGVGDDEKFNAAKMPITGAAHSSLCEEFLPICICTEAFLVGGVVARRCPVSCVNHHPTLVSDSIWKAVGWVYKNPRTPSPTSTTTFRFSGFLTQ
jgi:hypothetical protein